MQIKREQVHPLFESKFVKVYDLQYEEGKHYYDATRRDADHLAAIRTDEEFRRMLPDAVTCAVVLYLPGEEPKLLLDYEYRYPAGRYLLSPPAGLIDPADAAGAETEEQCKEAIFRAAKREIEEETGAVFGAGKNGSEDTIELVSPLLFSTPGMTDESNAIVCVTLHLDSADILNQNGGSGSEQFNGFRLVTKAEAEKLLKDGRDEYGNFYSVYTWIVMAAFLKVW